MNTKDIILTASIIIFFMSLGAIVDRYLLPRKPSPCPSSVQWNTGDTIEMTIHRKAKDTTPLYCSPMSNFKLCDTDGYIISRLVTDGPGCVTNFNDIMPFDSTIARVGQPYITGSRRVHRKKKLIVVKEKGKYYGTGLQKNIEWNEMRPIKNIAPIPYFRITSWGITDVSDSGKLVATRDSTGHWEIKNAQRALEVMYKLINHKP